MRTKAKEAKTRVSDQRAGSRPVCAKLSEWPAGWCCGPTPQRVFRKWFAHPDPYSCLSECQPPTHISLVQVTPVRSPVPDRKTRSEIIVEGKRRLQARLVPLCLKEIVMKDDGNCQWCVATATCECVWLMNVVLKYLKQAILPMSRYTTIPNPVAFRRRAIAYQLYGDPELHFAVCFNWRCTAHTYNMDHTYVSVYLPTN